MAPAAPRQASPDSCLLPKKTSPPPEQPLCLWLKGCDCLLKGLVTQQNLYHLLQEFNLKQQLPLGAFLVIKSLCVGGCWYFFLSEQELMLWSSLVLGARLSFAPLKNLPLDPVIKIWNNDHLTLSGC